MANLWRALALAWLGGMASPGLVDAAAVADGPPLAIVGAPADAATIEEGEAPTEPDAEDGVLAGRCDGA